MHKNNQSGNVFLFILIGIVLFAALGYSVAKGFRSDTSSTLTKKQIDLAADEILAYAQRLSRTVDRLRQRGCSENEISFENSTLTTLTNANAPSDKSCHVYDIAGGNMRFMVFDEGFFESSFSGHSNYRYMLPLSRARIINVGSTNAELIAAIPFLKDEICQAINNKVGLGKTIPIDTFSSGAFKGSYTVSGTPDIGDEDTNLAGEYNFCTQVSFPYNTFVGLLIAR